MPAVDQNDEGVLVSCSHLEEFFLEPSALVTHGLIDKKRRNTGLSLLFKRS